MRVRVSQCPLRNLKKNKLSKKVEKRVFDSNMVSAINQTLASADKVHLVNLIVALKSELATTNELLKIKNVECKDVVTRLNCCDDSLLAAQNRIQQLEKNSAKENKMVRPAIECMKNRSQFNR